MDSTPEPNKRSLMEEKAAKLRARGVTIETSRGPILFIPPENGNGYKIPSGSDLIRLLEERDRLSQDKRLHQKLMIFQRLLKEKKKMMKKKKISPISPSLGNQNG